MASPVQAVGLTFNWSFNATGNGGTSAQLGLVSGTISGLQDNAINASGLIATVLTTPDTLNQGVTFNSVSGGAITLANGVITASDVVFTGSNSVDKLILGLVNHYPEYYLINSGGYDLNNLSSPYSPPTGGTTFSPATPVPFDFNPSFGVVALGGIWTGRKVIKKIKTSKKSV